MKLIALALATIALSTGCDGSTEYGRCIGLDDEKDPTLKYEISTLNVVVGAVFVETLIVPAYVALDRFYCPIGKK